MRVGQEEEEARRVMKRISAIASCLSLALSLGRSWPDNGPTGDCSTTVPSTIPGRPTALCTSAVAGRRSSCKASSPRSHRPGAPSRP